MSKHQSTLQALWNTIKDHSSEDINILTRNLDNINDNPITIQRDILIPQIISDNASDSIDESMDQIIENSIEIIKPKK